jgi:lysozyme family protein
MTPAVAAFDVALTFVLKAEGADTNDPHDPGGLTRFGIAQTRHPELNVAELTLADAKAIYRRDYWDLIKGDQLPPHVALVVFDTAVNTGVATAAGLLQKAVGVEMDGAIGQRTLAAVRVAGPALLERYLGARIVYYASLRGAVRYLGGWARRCFDVHRAAIELRGSLPDAA